MPEDEPMAEVSSSQSDSEDSDGAEIDVSPQDASAIMAAEAALESNPYDYEGHANVSSGPVESLWESNIDVQV